MASEEFADELTAQSGPVIYCGPGIPKMGIRQYQVFSGGMSFIIKQAIEKIPEIEKLIVSCSELTSMREKISTRGTPENLYYEQVRGKIN